jgi:hypothetical protein
MSGHRSPRGHVHFLAASFSSPFVKDLFGESDTLKSYEQAKDFSRSIRLWCRLLYGTMDFTSIIDMLRSWSERKLSEDFMATQTAV